MAELYFDKHADRRLTALEADPSRAELLARINVVLDLLAADPGDARVRRRRFQNGLWCLVVAGNDGEWAVLWEPHPTVADAVAVQYLGPASFS